MALFKLQLLARDGGIIAEKLLKAVRHYEAIEMAEKLYATAALECKGFELWRGGRRIMRRLPFDARADS